MSKFNDFLRHFNFSLKSKSAKGLTFFSLISLIALIFYFAGMFSKRTDLIVKPPYISLKNNEILYRDLVRARVKALMNEKNYYLQSVKEDNFELVALLLFETRTNDENIDWPKTDWDSGKEMDNFFKYEISDSYLKSDEAKKAKEELIQVRRKYLDQLLSDYQNNKLNSPKMGKLYLASLIRSFILRINLLKA